MAESPKDNPGEVRVFVTEPVMHPRPCDIDNTMLAERNG